MPRPDPPHRFQRARRDHKSELAEDYVEVIGELIAEKGQARTVDIAERLGVSNVTVSRTVARLKKRGLVDTEPYRAIELTAEGEQLAEHSRRRHEIVYRFLRSLGIPHDTAAGDAEGIEHHVSDTTLAVFERAVRDFEQQPDD